MPFEYKVVNTVEEANQLSEDGFELFTILPPGPTGQRILRRTVAITPPT